MQPAITSLFEFKLATAGASTLTFCQITIMPTLAFALYGLLPIAAWFTYRRFYRTRRGLIGMMTLAVLLGSTLFIAGVHLIGNEYRDELMQLDLNQDGEFSDTEYTSEARIAMERLTRDTGKSMAPIVAPIATSIWTILMFYICKLCSLGFVDLRENRLNKKAEQAAPSNH